MHVNNVSWMVSTVQKTCRIKEHKYFDTHLTREESGRLTRYLYYLPYNTHLIMLTVGNAFGNLTDEAFMELDSCGVDISDMVEAGKRYTLAALVVIGSHCKTMYELYENDPAYLSLQLNGTHNTVMYFHAYPEHPEADLAGLEMASKKSRFFRFTKKPGLE